MPSIDFKYLKKNYKQFYDKFVEYSSANWSSDDLEDEQFSEELLSDFLDEVEYEDLSFTEFIESTPIDIPIKIDGNPVTIPVTIQNSRVYSSEFFDSLYTIVNSRVSIKFDGTLIDPSLDDFTSVKKVWEDTSHFDTSSLDNFDPFRVFDEMKDDLFEKIQVIASSKLGRDIKVKLDKANTKSKQI